MELIDQVSELLYKHNCVIIPGFGGFVANFKSARFQEDRLLASPAIKRVAFNQSLVENDGLLIRHLAAIKGLTYEEAEKEVAVFVRFLHDRLTAYRNYEFRNIGSLYLNKDDKIVFVPYEGLNFYPKSYGLEDVKVKRLQRVIDKQRIAEQHMKEPEIQEAPAVRPMFPWKAAVAVFVLLGAFGILFWQIGKQGKNGIAVLEDKPLPGTEQTASMLGDSDGNVGESGIAKISDEPISVDTTIAEFENASEPGPFSPRITEPSEPLKETSEDVVQNGGNKGNGDELPDDVTSEFENPEGVSTEEGSDAERSKPTLQELREKRLNLFSTEIIYHVVVARGEDVNALQPIMERFRNRSFQPYLIDGLRQYEKLVCVEKFRNEEHAKQYLRLVQKHESKSAEIVKISGTATY